MTEAAANHFGQYMGRLIFEPLSDGRLMQIIEPFGFLDSEQKRWQVPVGTKVDGASIPQPLWSIIGGPFEGKYREASVVHDYYCDIRTEPWRAVHRVFYYAMRASGVSERRAKLMYAAVYFAGPRWSDTAVDNARLPKHDAPTILFNVQHSPFGQGILNGTLVNGESADAFLRSGQLMWPKGNQTTLTLRSIDKLIESVNPDLEAIENSIDSAAKVIESVYCAEERRRLLDINGLSTE